MASAASAAADSTAATPPAAAAASTSTATSNSGFLAVYVAVVHDVHPSDGQSNWQLEIRATSESMTLHHTANIINRYSKKDWIDFARGKKDSLGDMHWSPRGYYVFRSPNEDDVIEVGSYLTSSTAITISAKLVGPKLEAAIEQAAANGVQFRPE